MIIILCARPAGVKTPKTIFNINIFNVTHDNNIIIESQRFSESSGHTV